RGGGVRGAGVGAGVAVVWGGVLRGAAGAVGGQPPRGLLSGRPPAVEVGGRRCALLGWSRPWPIDEAWWEPTPDGEPRRPRARMQVVPERAAALLLCGVLGDEQGNWIVEGVYE
ncbi:hypothetical protein AB0P16_18595, partial [Dietzia maris]